MYESSTLMTKEKSTLIKGGLALLILAHHILEFMESSDTVYPIHIGYLLVAAFFWISGYGIRKSLKQRKNYLKGFLPKSMSKLYIPFLGVTAIYIGVRSCFGITYSLETILVSMLGLKTIASFSWFVFEIIALYVLFYVAFEVSEKYGEQIVFLAVILFIFIAWKMGMENYWFVSTIAFPLGIVTASREEYFVKKLFCVRKILYVSIPLFVFTVIGGNEGIVASFISEKEMISLWSKANLIISCILFTYCFGFLIQYIPEKKNKILTFWGKYSYELYLMQGLFVRGFKEIVVLSNDFLYIICVIICSLGSALLFKRMMDMANIGRIQLMTSSKF